MDDPTFVPKSNITVAHARNGFIVYVYDDYEDTKWEGEPIKIVFLTFDGLVKWLENYYHPHDIRMEFLASNQTSRIGAEQQP